jgi:hypothetical protein
MKQWRDVKWRVEGTSRFRVADDDTAIDHTRAMLRHLNGVTVEDIEIQILGVTPIQGV